METFVQKNADLRWLQNQSDHLNHFLVIFELFHVFCSGSYANPRLLWRKLCHKNNSQLSKFQNWNIFYNKLYLCWCL